MTVKRENDSLPSLGEEGGERKVVDEPARTAE